jgi:hypothetical protein
MLVLVSGCTSGAAPSARGTAGGAGTASAAAAVGAAKGAPAGATDGETPLPTFSPIASSARPVFIANDEKGCGLKAPTDTYLLRTTGVEGGAGQYALIGYQEQTVCGPNVPDDVEYNDGATLLTVRLEPAAKITLLGSLPDNQYAADAGTLVSLIQGAVASPSPRYTEDALAWFGGVFQIKLDAAGEISQITELYHP